MLTRAIVFLGAEPGFMGVNVWRCAAFGGSHTRRAGEWRNAYLRGFVWRPFSFRRVSARRKSGGCLGLLVPRQLTSGVSTHQELDSKQSACNILLIDQGSNSQAQGGQTTV